jgi:hypothetical protein
MPLAEALDTTNLVWTTSGNLPWVGQATVMHDGVDAGRSGAITHSQTTSLQTTVNGPGTVSFWWKVSSQSGSDLLRFYIGGSQQVSISGEVDWEQRTFSVPSGSQVLEWRYTKNSSTSAGQDRAWVDQVQFAPLPAAITTQPSSQSADVGGAITFSGNSTASTLSTGPESAVQPMPV